MVNQELWEKCVAFHGHACGGLAIGYRMCEIVMREMNFTFSKDEEIVCVSENDACCLDAVQVITGCTMGKGNLILRPTGKTAFSFFSRKTGSGIRIILRDVTPILAQAPDARIPYVFEQPEDTLFSFAPPKFPMPERAKIMQSFRCSCCGEFAPESRIHVEDGKFVCNDCYHGYSRGW